MTQDATSQPSETTTDTTSATEDDNAQQMLAAAVAQATDTAGSTTAATGAAPADDKPAATGDTASTDDKLGDSGKRALTSERKARREAEKQLTEMRAALQQYEDAQKTELQKAQEQAKQYQQELTTTRVANARLMAAATYNIPADLIDLLGDGTDEEIDARAKQLADYRDTLAASTVQPAPEPPKAAPASTRPVESLTPGGKPASAEAEDPNTWLRRMAGRAP